MPTKWGSVCAGIVVHVVVITVVCEVRVVVQTVDVEPLGLAAIALTRCACMKPDVVEAAVAAFALLAGGS